MTRFLVDVAVGALAVAGGYLWLVLRPIRVECATCKALGALCYPHWLEAGMPTHA